MSRIVNNTVHSRTPYMSRARDALVLRWVKRRARCVTGTHPNTHVHVSYDEAFMLLEASQEAGALPFMLLDRRLVGAQASCPTRTWRIERGAPKRAVLGGVRWTHAVSAYRQGRCTKDWSGKSRPPSLHSRQRLLLGLDEPGGEEPVRAGHVGRVGVLGDVEHGRLIHDHDVDDAVLLRVEQRAPEVRLVGDG